MHLRGNALAERSGTHCPAMVSAAPTNEATVGNMAQCSGLGALAIPCSSAGSACATPMATILMPASRCALAVSWVRAAFPDPAVTTTEIEKAREGDKKVGAGAFATEGNIQNIEPNK